MADTCKICGRRIVRKNSNWMLKDGFMIHVKCPTSKQSVIPASERTEYDHLRDRLKEVSITCPRGYLAEHQMNFARVMQSVKRMHDNGYTYGEIEYALDVVVDEQKGFWGIGAVENRIDVTIMRKKKYEERKENTQKVKNTYDSLDLSGMMTKSEEW